MSDTRILVGVDEVGYGAIAGPITICVARVKPEWRDELMEKGIRDTKRMSESRRNNLANWIVEHRAADYAIVNQPAGLIEQITPWDAVCKGARTALIILSNQLGLGADLSKFEIMMDGKSPLHGIPRGVVNKSLVGADTKILEVMVAALLAKVHRDFLMTEKAQRHPIYRWDKNKGYGELEHLEALFQWGPLLEHRMNHGVKKAMRNYALKAHPYEAWPSWLKELHPTRYNKASKKSPEISRPTEETP